MVGGVRGEPQPADDRIATGKLALQRFVVAAAGKCTRRWVSASVPQFALPVGDRALVQRRQAAALNVTARVAPQSGVSVDANTLTASKAAAKTDELVERLGLGLDVRESLRQTYERWDGRGAYGMKGEEIALSSRLINLADVVEVFGRAGGVEAAMTVARERSGSNSTPSWSTRSASRRRWCWPTWIRRRAGRR